MRSLAGYGTMLPSMLGGVAVGLLNRDRHEIARYGVSSWVERLFAITGVTLKVQGEENLWSHRPAVFIYNHRNNFDPYVAIKLVHRDWGSVAKQEIAGPLAGPMQWLTPNVAYIDRSDPNKAIEGLAPVTELLRSGVSVLVAPEGTRSITGSSARSRRARSGWRWRRTCPIVPIVIRNADQVATREAQFIREGHHRRRRSAADCGVGLETRRARPTDRGGPNALRRHAGRLAAWLSTTTGSTSSP